MAVYSGAQIPRYKGFVKHSSAQEEKADPKVKHTWVGSDIGAFDQLNHVASFRSRKWFINGWCVHTFGCYHVEVTKLRFVLLPITVLYSHASGSSCPQDKITALYSRWRCETGAKRSPWLNWNRLSTWYSKLAIAEQINSNTRMRSVFSKRFRAKILTRLSLITQYVVKINELTLTNTFLLTRLSMCRLTSCTLLLKHLISSKTFLLFCIE